MAPRMRQLAGLLFIALAGCTELFGRQGAPPDPLFTNGKPTESMVVPGPPAAPHFSEPTPPLNKSMATY
jgi:hypothetical protein